MKVKRRWILAVLLIFVFGACAEVDEAPPEDLAPDTGDIVPGPFPYEYAPPCSLEDPDCEPFVPPTYFQGCEEGQWDAREEGCTAHRVCFPGEYVAAPGTETTDTVCEPCAEGTFSDVEDAEQCIEWLTCEEGEYVQSEGSASEDRICTECPVGMQSSGENALECEATQATTNENENE